MFRTILVFFLILPLTFLGQGFSADSCGEFIKPEKVFGIKGTHNCLGLVVFKDIVIRIKEVDPKSVISATVCASGYSKFGDIGANAAVIIDTRQTFDYVTPESLRKSNKRRFRDKKKIYFLNGYLISKDSLKISKDAIRQIKVIDAKNYNGQVDKNNTVLIGIWTYTKKEIRKSEKYCDPIHKIN